MPAIEVTRIPGGQDAPHGLPAEVTSRLGPLLSAPGQLILVARQGSVIVGVLAGLRRRTTAMLRIVRFWVDPADANGAGEEIGRALVAALELISLEADILTWRIASATGDDELPPALRRLTGIAAAEQGSVYTERKLRNAQRPPKPVAPLYPQSTGFTCGPASLAMAFAGLEPAVVPDRQLEIALWREATTVIGLTGPGGCDPYGLALAVAARGYALRLFTSASEPVLLDRGNTEAKRELMTFVQADFKSRVLASGIDVEHRAFESWELRDAIAEGAIAVVLIDQMETHGRTAPHWVVVHAVHDDLFLLNDPWIETDALETEADVLDLPIHISVLERMARYGEPSYRAALLIGRSSS
ncbi:peptidase C39 family protein [Bosea sp. 2YAB26]|uniref:peptidase C39 family protein n=1 Tax=Bosea sp. 2YAB26 TaxID=3237478 RepID=UPI003F90A1AF